MTPEDVHEMRGHTLAQLYTIQFLIRDIESALELLLDDTSYSLPTDDFQNIIEEVELTRPRG